MGCVREHRQSQPKRAHAVPVEELATVSSAYMHMDEPAASHPQRAPRTNVKVAKARQHHTRAR